ncbi:MAG: hypothetical protein BWY66_00075 [bacterium ADurb.Bin374]|nr:MAG: hypothetical protein BWY66_00075 [bacterium ADurb.Bin374]
MNNFLWQKWSAKMQLHHKTVLKNVNAPVVLVERAVWMLYHSVSLRHLYTATPRVVTFPPKTFASQCNAHFVQPTTEVFLILQLLSEMRHAGF